MGRETPHPVSTCRQGTPGCGRFPHQRLPALCPLVFEGTKKEAHPARFKALGPGAGPAERWLFDKVKKRPVIPERAKGEPGIDTPQRRGSWIPGSRLRRAPE